MTVTSGLRLLAYERTDPRDKSLAWLRENGIDVRHSLTDSVAGHDRYTEEEIIVEAQDCEAVLGAMSARFTRGVIERLPRLRFISKIGIGIDSIDVAAATERGIVVTNTPETAGVVAVAEHTIAMMLAVLKRLTIWTPANLQAGRWRGSTMAGTLEGSTVGIIGFGRIGRAVAERLRGWNVTVLYFDPHTAEDTGGATRTSLDDLLARSDIVTLHCAATPENHHLINGGTLALMKPGAILLNAARGTLVDTPALVASLKSGALGGAGLDVFDPEPPDPADELLTLNNVVATPHVAARSLEVFLDRRWRAARNLVAVVRGEPCPDVVNPAALAQRDPT